MSLTSGAATGSLTETMPEFHGSLWDTDAWLAMSNLPSVFGFHDPTSDLFGTGTGGFPFLSTDTNLQCSALSQVSTEATTHMSQPHQHTENATSANESLNESRVEGTIGETCTPASLSKYASDAASPLPRKDYPCFEFPEPSPDILQATRIEMFGHIGGISDHQFQSIQRFYQQQRACESSRFISQEVLHAFVELYLEYFDSKFPFLHRSKLKGTGLEWVVLIAIAAVGSQYSMIPGSHDYGLVLQDLLGRALADCVSGVLFWLVKSLLIRTPGIIKIEKDGHCLHPKLVLTPHSTILLGDKSIPCHVTMGKKLPSRSTEERGSSG